MANAIGIMMKIAQSLRSKKTGIESGVDEDNDADHKKRQNCGHGEGGFPEKSTLLGEQGSSVKQSNKWYQAGEGLANRVCFSSCLCVSVLRTAQAM